jgi:hypothetical protein
MWRFTLSLSTGDTMNQTVTTGELRDLLCRTAAKTDDPVAVALLAEQINKSLSVEYEIRNATIGFTYNIGMFPINKNVENKE